MTTVGPAASKCAGIGLVSSLAAARVTAMEKR